jgi:hypothetical protein
VELERAILQMRQNADRLQALVTGISEEQARWKPDPASWSMLEVINHLADEEREDFRAALEVVRRGEPNAWPQIDPPGWVTSRAYDQREFDASLRRFLSARQASLTWLHGLADIDWDLTYVAPFGEMSAGDVLAAWVAHDLLHMRQLVELHWGYTMALVAPYQVRYAGA